MQRESVTQSVLVATCLCLVCSTLVSSAAVLLRPAQTGQQSASDAEGRAAGGRAVRRREPISELFQKVDMRIVDWKRASLLTLDSVDRDAYDPKVAPKEPDFSVAIRQEEDLAGLKRREKLSAVYLVRSAAGELQQLILPVRGKGLWSTMYGFLSLESDFHTVRGITFYEHGETPGLGGEIESPKFKRQWQGKVVRDENGTPGLKRSEEAWTHKILRRSTRLTRLPERRLPPGE